MTIRFDDYESPPGLEEDIPECCALRKVIDTVCPDAGCPYADQQICDETPRVIWPERNMPGKSPIFRTRPKTRCIL